MDRQIVWPGAIPLETDLLNTNKQAMVAIAKLASALLGTGTTINGLSCGPTAPASLQVSVGAGEIYALKNIDDTAYSSLTADTTHQILKQGILLDAVTLSCPAPGTTGQSINYLVQAAFAETDTNATVLPFYNASNPSQAWNGPNNSGSTSVTTRADQCVVTVKAGTAATTGSQTTPSPDSGNVGLYVVTVAYGQTTITAGNISVYSANPSIPSSGITSAMHNALYAKSVAGGSDVTLTAQEAANPILSFTGTLTANINVIVPAASHQWIVNNNTSGAYSVTLKTAAGTGILIPQGQSMILYCDGVNVVAAGAANQSSFTPFEFTAASNGSNTFTCGYTPGNVEVIRNGSTLLPSVYTATNGSSITVPNCVAGDKVLVYAFTSFTVANALTQAAADTRYLQLSGGTLTGALTLAGNPTNNLHAAPKQYVDSAVAAVKQLQSISSSVASNALTLNYAGGSLDFRNATLANGAPNAGVTVGALSITVPSGATLGTVNGQQARLVLLLAYNGGTPVLCVANLAGGVQLDETNLISPTTISAGATSASTIYSASAVSANSPYRVIGFVDITEATAGTWASDATLKQGTGGQALAALSSLGYGQTWQNVAASRALGTTYYNTTGKPIAVGVTVIGSTGGGGLSINVGGITVVQQVNPTSASGQFGGTVIVPPGATYLISSSYSISAWAELR